MFFSTCSDPDLAFHMANTFSSRLAAEALEQRLLVGDLQAEVRGDRVGKLRRNLDLADLATISGGTFLLSFT